MDFWLVFSARFRGACLALNFCSSVIFPILCMRSRTWSRWAMAASRSLNGEKMWGPRMMPTRRADWPRDSCDVGMAK